MKRDPQLIAAMRDLCRRGSDEDVHRFLEEVFRASFLGGYDHAKAWPDQTHEDAMADMDELAMRSSTEAH